MSIETMRLIRDGRMAVGGEGNYIPMHMQPLFKDSKSYVDGTSEEPVSYTHLTLPTMAVV